jgi:hypothetical protein
MEIRSSKFEFTNEIRMMKAECRAGSESGDYSLPGTTNTMPSEKIIWQSGWQPCQPDEAEKIQRELKLELERNPAHPLYGKDVRIVGVFLDWDYILVQIRDENSFVHIDRRGWWLTPKCVFLDGIDAANEFIKQWRKDPESEMTDGDQPRFKGVMDGKIIEFITENRFRVRLSDGQQVLAVMPDELLPIAVEHRHLLDDPKRQCICVQVEFRKPPAMHRILEAHVSVLVG